MTGWRDPNLNGVVFWNMMMNPKKMKRKSECFGEIQRFFSFPNKAYPLLDGMILQIDHLVIYIARRAWNSTIIRDFPLHFFHLSSSSEQIHRTSVLKSRYVPDMSISQKLQPSLGNPTFFWLGRWFFRSFELRPSPTGVTKCDRVIPRQRWSKTQDVVTVVTRCDKWCCLFVKKQHLTEIPSGNLT